MDLPEGMHLYAPGDHEYLAIDWTSEPVDGLELAAPDYPEAEALHLPAIDETVPVYHGKVRIVRDLRLLGRRHRPESLEGVDRIELQGEFHYQACDETRCYLPTSIPLTWTIAIGDHDLTRAPEEIRRENAR